MTSISMIAVFCLCKCIHVLVCSAGLNKMFFFLLASHASSSDFYPNATTDWLVVCIFIFARYVTFSRQRQNSQQAPWIHKHTLCWKIVIHAISHLANYITLTWWQIGWICNSAEYQGTKMDVQTQWMQNFVTAQQ